MRGGARCACAGSRGRVLGRRVAFWGAGCDEGCDPGSHHSGARRGMLRRRSPDFQEPGLSKDTHPGSSETSSCGFGERWGLAFGRRTLVEREPGTKAATGRTGPLGPRGVGQASAHPERCHQGRCALLAVRPTLPAATGPGPAAALRAGAECAGRGAPAGASCVSTGLHGACGRRPAVACVAAPVRAG